MMQHRRTHVVWLLILAGCAERQGPVVPEVPIVGQYAVQSVLIANDCGSPALPVELVVVESNDVFTISGLPEAAFTFELDDKSGFAASQTEHFVNFGTRRTSTLVGKFDTGSFQATLVVDSVREIGGTGRLCGRIVHWAATRRNG